MLRRLLEEVTRRRPVRSPSSRPPLVMLLLLLLLQPRGGNHPASAPPWRVPAEKQAGSLAWPAADSTAPWHAMLPVLAVAVDAAPSAWQLPPGLPLMCGWLCPHCRGQMLLGSEQLVSTATAARPALLRNQLCAVYPLDWLSNPGLLWRHKPCCAFLEALLRALQGDGPARGQLLAQAIQLGQQSGHGRPLLGLCPTALAQQH
eukprot:1021941-Pelagomonas_calceolata.AAC.11